MAGTITDVFSQASSGTAPLASTLTAQKAIGASSLSVAASTGWPTASNSTIWFKLYQATTVSTAQGNLLLPVSGTETLWKGLLSGLTVNSLTLTSGTDQLYPINSIVEPMFTSSQMDAMYTGLTAQHSQLDGSHTNVTATSVTAPTATFTNLTASTSATLPNNSVTAANLSTTAITLGTPPKITSIFNTGGTAVTQVTDLTQTVTIPAGSRGLEIEVFCPYITNSAANGFTSIGIWDGVVGTSTQVGGGQTTCPVANNGYFCIAKAVIDNPAAGSKTYNASLNGNGNTASMGATTASPAFMLIKLR